METVPCLGLDLRFVMSTLVPYLTEAVKRRRNLYREHKEVHDQMARLSPSIQEQIIRDPATKDVVRLKVYAHAPAFFLPERVILEIDAGVGVTLRLSPESAAWLGHTLLSAQDDALRMAGPDYDDHRTQQRAEDRACFDDYQRGVMDPRD